MALSCQSTLRLTCSIGGKCEVNATTLEEFCVCDAGFTRDASLLHNPVNKDCSRPESAYLGWLIFQTMANLVVAYRLQKQLLRSKGKVKILNASWLVALFASWLMVLGLNIQGGTFEISMTAFALLTIGVIRAGFCIFDIFLDARCAIEMRSPERSLFLSWVFMVALLLFFVPISIIAAAVSRNEPIFAVVVLVLVIGIFVAGFTVISVIFYINISLEKTLRGMMRESVSNDNMDEKPALVRRLRLFRSALKAAALLVGSPIILLIAVFYTLGSFPLMWIATMFAFVCFPIVGLFLNQLNELIQSFKIEKIRNNGPLMNSSHALMLLTSGPFYYNRKLLSKPYQILKNRTFVTDLFGWEIGQRCMKLAMSNVSKALVTILALVCQGLAFAVIVRKDFIDVTGLIAIGVITVILLLFVFFSTANKQIAWASFKKSPSFLYRIILLTAAVIAAGATLDYGLRSLVVGILDYVAFVFFLLDALKKEDFAYYRSLIYVLACAIPFLVWFMFAFDLVDGRRNIVLVSSGAPHPYIWSEFHFVQTIHIIIAWCVLMDGLRLIKNTHQNFLFLSCPIKVSIAKLPGGDGDDPSGSVISGTSNSPFSDIDFTEAEFTRDRRSTQSGINSPSVRRTTYLAMLPERRHTLGSPRAAPKQVKEPATSFVTGIIIRQEDALINFVLRRDLVIKTLRCINNYGRFINAVTGVMIAGGIGAWVGLVLTSVIQPSLSLVFALALCLPALLFRMSLKSWRLIRFLMFRVENGYDSVVLFGMMVLLGSTLASGTSDDALRSVPLLIMLGLVYADWRLSDALVTPLQMGVYNPEYFLPTLASVVALPLVIYCGLVPDVSFVSEQLVPPLNASQVTNIPDPFALTYPPQGSLARIKFSQFVLDSIILFALRLILEFIERTAIRYFKPKQILLDFIKSTVAPEVHSDASQIRPVKSDPFWTPVSYSEEDPLFLPGALIEGQEASSAGQGSHGMGARASQMRNDHSSVVPVDGDE